MPFTGGEESAVVLRGLYNEDHEDFRAIVREFVAQEVAGNVERWEDAGIIDREVWLAAGKHGVLGLSAPEDAGGAGMLGDYRYRYVVLEELATAFATSLSAGFSLQDDIAIPYIVKLANKEQRERWLPGMASGELIGAIAMTEPGTGSDLLGVRTSGRRVDGGWLVNGSKTFITNGIHADLIVTVVRTDPSAGAKGMSLLVIERGMPGFDRGRNLKKVGLHGQDTSELFFTDVFVPDDNVLGLVGGGFAQLMDLLPLERLSIAAASTAAAAATLSTTLTYTNARFAFGQPIGDFQSARFTLADLATEVDVTRAFVDKAVLSYNAAELSVVDAAKAKLWATEMHHRVVDRCVQLHGGNGYMIEYPVARAYQDARVQRIYGGTNEIMRHIIGRDLVGRR